MVAEHLTELGVPAEPADVINSAQAAARLPGEVTITRGLDKSGAFTDWIKETLNNGAINTARQNLTIEVKDTTGATLRRIQLLNAWASRWEGPTLSAGESSAATETVTIVFEEISVE
ncbi:phage tail protein [Kitasatospora sp. NPDC001225]